MPQELLTQVDDNDNVMGLKSGSDFSDGKLIHRSVYLIIRNEEGEILLQKRPDSKEWHPGLYSFSVTGSVCDETYDECMKRRILEELSTTIPIRKLFKFHHFDDIDKAFKSVYSAELKTFKSDRKEFLWISVNELKKELKENPQRFAPPFLAGMQIYLKSWCQ